MDSVPTEIHAHIFRFACTDDGDTGCALARVSQYVRAATRPYIYQSLAVAGPAAIAALVDRLHHLPPHLRRIRHLFVSDCKQHAVPADDDTTVAAIERLLDLASPSVQTLTVLARNPFSSTLLLTRVFTTHFPALTSLAVRGLYPFPYTSAPTMPHLTHLHLSGHRNPHGLLQLGALPAVCPRLAHLRISGLSGALSFAHELDAALRAYPHPSLQPSITHLYVSPGPAPLRRCRLPIRETVHDRMMDVLRDLKAQQGPVRFQLLNLLEDGCAYDLLREEWEMRAWELDKCELEDST